MYTSVATTPGGVTILNNARIFTGLPDQNELIQAAIILDGSKINFVGGADSAEIKHARDVGAVEMDVHGRIVSPGFIEGHGHIMDFAQSLNKCNIIAAKSWADIRDQIETFAAANPAAPRLIFKGWLQSSIDWHPVRTMLDELDHRPIYVEAMDLHSVWCNTAALTETGIMSMEDDPVGGKIHRDRSGRPSGLLEEGAMFEFVVPFLFKQLTTGDRMNMLRQAFMSYTSSGYTGIVDMLMDDDKWATLETYRQVYDLPLDIAAHWIIHYGSDAEIQKQLQRAIAMNKKYHPSSSPSFCIVGIKLIGDGTVDGCTAGLSKPYENLDDICPPIWPADKMREIVRQADAANLQVAVHAIGDQTITNTIDAIAALGLKRSRRHRIEHLELTSEKDARRLGELGIIASVQPVHSDPVLFRGWPILIGADRCKRAFAYKDFLEAGARMAFGTDAPTMPHLPMPNLYNASTRRSALEPQSEETTNEYFRVPLPEAVRALTYGAAYSREAESWCGSLRPGMSANLVIWESDWRSEHLLTSRVCQTWYRGARVFDVKSKVPRDFEQMNYAAC